MLEMNCETDFVAKSSAFLGAYGKLMDLYVSKPIDLESFLSSKFDSTVSVQENIRELITKTGENIKISNVLHMKGKVIGSYIHNKLVDDAG